jgi:hypothetical protein
MEHDHSTLPIKIESKTGNTLAGFMPLAQNPVPLSNRYYSAATSDNTRRAYQADIKHYDKRIAISLRIIGIVPLIPAQ